MKVPWLLELICKNPQMSAFNCCSLLQISTFMHLSWEAQKTYLVVGRAEPRGQNKNQVWQHNPARRRLWCATHLQGFVAPLYITFQATQTESFELTGWEISLALQAPQKRRKCHRISHKGRKKPRFSPNDQRDNRWSHFGPCFLYSSLPWSQRSLRRFPEDSFTCAPHADTSSSSSSLALSPQLCLTSSHPRPFPDPFQGFTSPPLSSSQQLLLLQLVAQPSDAAPLVLNAALSPPLSLFLTRLCSSLSHILTLSHTLALHQQHICCRLQQNLHMPLIHINNNYHLYLGYKWLLTIEIYSISHIIIIEVESGKKPKSEL